LRDAATAADAPEVVAQSWQWEAIVELERADLPKVRHALDQVDALNEQLDLRYFRWATTARRAAVALSSGFLDDAEQLINESAQLEVHDFSILTLQVAVLRWLQGRAAEVLALLPEIVPATDRPFDRIRFAAQSALYSAESG